MTDAERDLDLTALRAWDPPGEALPDAAGARARARARLDAHVAAARPGRERLRALRRPPRRWLITVPATAALAAVIAVLVVVLGTSRVPEQRRSYSAATAPASAAQALEQAARAAEAGSPAFPRPDQFFYTFTEATYLACSVDAGASYCALSTSRRETWISQDRRGQVRTEALGVTWPSAAERRKWVAAGRPSLAAERSGTTAASPNHAFYLGNERMSAAQMRDFAQTGAQLYRRVHDGVTDGQGPSRDGETFVQLNDALRGLPTSPRLRAALFRAFAFVPGLGFVAHAKDRLGRAAVAITHVENGTRHEILFDPKTSALLGERDVVAGPVRDRGYSAPEGTVVGDAAYRDQGVVDAIGERP
jgi:hypothetical protein